MRLFHKTVKIKHMQKSVMRQGTRMGRHIGGARFPAWEPEQRRCRRSEAEPHAPAGLSPQVTWGGAASS